MIRRRSRNPSDPKNIVLKIRYNAETEKKLNKIVETKNLSKAEFLRQCIDAEYEKIK